MRNENNNNRFLLLYGSQTGQAEAISEEFRDRARDLGLNPDFQCMQGVDRTFSLEHENLAVIVISTSGDGDPPDTARKIVRRLKKRTLTKDYLKNLCYCLLALGDSNYLNFCNCGKLFDQRLRELGAQPFQDTCYADDAVGLEVVAEPWIARSLIYLAQHFNVKIDINLMTSSMSASVNNSNTTLLHSPILKDIELGLPTMPQSYLQIKYEPETKLEITDLPIQNHLQFPSCASSILTATITKAKRLTTSPKVKEYVQLWIELPVSDVDYQPGDAFGLVPENDSSEVHSILDMLGLASVADTPCFISSMDNSRLVPPQILPNCTLRHLMQTCCDIRSPPKKTLLRIMAEHATNSQEKRRLLELSSKQGSSEFLQLIRGNSLSILELLKAFPSSKNTPVEAFLELLPRLQARQYSVANSPFEMSNSFTVVFSVVEFEAGGSRDAVRNGVCTGFLKRCTKELLDKSFRSNDQDLILGLEDLKLEENYKKIHVFKRNSSSFLLPEDSSIPLIMIGPGTGVAPFVGFLKHRLKLREQGETNFGETWLYYGCRHKEEDFLFEKELTDLQEKGILNRLQLSFSRDANSSSRYVQDNVKKDFLHLLNLIDNCNAVVFICGDAKNMAKDVLKAFIESYERVTGSTSKEAVTWHSKLQNSKRYVQDLWL